MGGGWHARARGADGSYTLLSADEEVKKLRQPVAGGAKLQLYLAPQPSKLTARGFGGLRRTACWSIDQVSLASRAGAVDHCTAL